MLPVFLELGVAVWELKCLTCSSAALQSSESLGLALWDGSHSWWLTLKLSLPLLYFSCTE